MKHQDDRLLSIKLLPPDRSFGALLLGADAPDLAGRSLPPSCDDALTSAHTAAPARYGDSIAQWNAEVIFIPVITLWTTHCYFGCGGIVWQTQDPGSSATDIVGVEDARTIRNFSRDAQHQRHQVRRR